MTYLLNEMVPKPWYEKLSYLAFYLVQVPVKCVTTFLREVFWQQLAIKAFAAGPDERPILKPFYFSLINIHFFLRKISKNWRKFANWFRRLCEVLYIIFKILTRFAWIQLSANSQWLLYLKAYKKMANIWRNFRNGAANYCNI